jgi:RNA polymerase sigma-70 factor (ECF subfamily)
MLSKQDQKWFMEQVRREHLSLRAYVRGLGVRIDAVDDVAHDALVIAMEKLPDFDRERDFGAWVRGIAKRVVLNLRHKEGRRAAILSARITDVVANLGLDDTGERQRGDELVALRACLQKLPEKSRQILHSRYYEDMSPSKIAGHVDKSSEHVRQILFRVRKQLLACVRQRLASGALS